MGGTVRFGGHRERWVLSDEYSESNGLSEMEIGYSIHTGAGGG